MILHIVNLTGFETGHAPAYEYFPAGPIIVQVGTNMTATRIRQLVSGETRSVEANQGIVEIFVNSVADHEVIVIDPARS